VEEVAEEGFDKLATGGRGGERVGGGNVYGRELVQTGEKAC
jgi:hypothetical protein